MMDGVPPLGDRLGYLLKAVYGELAGRIDTALDPLELSARQLVVLSVIMTNDSLPQVGVSDLLDVDRTTMVEILDGLERQGLVERRRDARDRRRNLLSVTALGRARVIEAEKVRAEVEADYLSALPVGDARRLVASLQALAPSRTTSAPVAS